MMPGRWGMVMAYYGPLVVAGIVVLAVLLVVMWLAYGCHAHLHLKDSHYYGEEDGSKVIWEINDNDEVD